MNLVGDVFIETGTFTSNTLANVIGCKFKKIHSIDIVEEYITKAREKFSSDPRVTIHHGSSPEVLPQIIDAKKQTTFWLDAHFQGHKENEFDPKYGQCPLLKELEAVFGTQWKKPPIVLIDDAHMFEKLPACFNAKQWPTIAQIKSLIPDGYKHQRRENIIVIAHD